MAGLLQRQRTELLASSLALFPSFPLVHPESSSCHRSFFAKRKPRARQGASGTFLGGGKEGYIEAQWGLLQRWVSARGILILPHSITLCFPVTDALFMLVCPVIKPSTDISLCLFVPATLFRLNMLVCIFLPWDFVSGVQYSEGKRKGKACKVTERGGYSVETSF